MGSPGELPTTDTPLTPTTCPPHSAVPIRGPVGSRDRGCWTPPSPSPSVPVSSSEDRKTNSPEQGRVLPAAPQPPSPAPPAPVPPAPAPPPALPALCSGHTGLPPHAGHSPASGSLHMLCAPPETPCPSHFRKGSPFHPSALKSRVLREVLPDQLGHQQSPPCPNTLYVDPACFSSHPSARTGILCLLPACLPHRAVDAGGGNQVSPSHCCVPGTQHGARHINIS